MTYYSMIYIHRGLFTYLYWLIAFYTMTSLLQTEPFLWNVFYNKYWPLYISF